MTKKELFEKADELKQRMSERRSNHADKLKTADSFLKKEFIYNITEMNGCKLNRAQIDDIIADVEAVEQKDNNIYNNNKQKLYEDVVSMKEEQKDNSLQDQLWLRGIVKAFDYAINSGRSNDFTISVNTIKHLHYLIYGSILTDAGEYRKTRSQIFETEYQGAAPEELEHLTEHFINQMNSSKRILHPIEYAAICHKRITDIFPFEEGTGLVAILLMNMVLENEGYGFTIIPFNQYSEYIRALMTSQREKTPDFDVFIKFIAECVIEVESARLSQLD